MKKCFLLITIVLILCGTAWGQDMIPNNPPPILPFGQTEAFDWMYANTASSTENATSAGIFGSDIDDYIGVNDYDPSIGTFFFLGGGGNAALGAGDVSLGFGTALGNGYLGLYYGGGLVDGETHYNKPAKERYSEARWRNNLVAMYGLNDGLSFRLDFQLNPRAARLEIDGDVQSIIEEGTTLGFTLGGFQLGALTSYASIGFSFPSNTTTEFGDVSVTVLGNSVLGFQFGISSESGLSADALVNIGFASSNDGDSNKDGDFGVGLQAAYRKVFEMENFAFGFRPRVQMYMIIPDKGFGYRLNAGAALGVKYAVNEKFALYTGLDIAFFEWIAAAQKNAGDQGTFTGIDANNLNLGLTFTPVSNVVIGTNFSTFLNNLFAIRPGTLDVRTNPALSAQNDFLSQVFRMFAIDLTFSIKL